MELIHGVRSWRGEVEDDLAPFLLSTLSLTRYLAGIGVVGVLVYMCSVGGVVSVVVQRMGLGLWVAMRVRVMMSSFLSSLG